MAPPPASLLPAPAAAANGRRLEQPEHGDTVGGADEDLAVGDHRRDELVAIAEAVAATAGLGAVVVLLTQVGRVVGVQYGGTAGRTLQSPENGIGASLCGEGGRGNGIGKRLRRLRTGCGRELRVRKDDRLQC